MKGNIKITFESLMLSLLHDHFSFFACQRIIPTSFQQFLVNFPLWKINIIYIYEGDLDFTWIEMHSFFNRILLSFRPIVYAIPLGGGGGSIVMMTLMYVFARPYTFKITTNLVHKVWR